MRVIFRFRWFLLNGLGPNINHLDPPLWSQTGIPLGETRDLDHPKQSHVARNLRPRAPGSFSIGACRVPLGLYARCCRMARSGIDRLDAANYRCADTMPVRLGGGNLVFGC